MVLVYVLQSLKDRGYYIGITNNLEKRLLKHNMGGVKSTQDRKPFLIVYKEEYSTYATARIREKELKSFKGGNEFKKLFLKK